MSNAIATNKPPYDDFNFALTKKDFERNRQQFNFKPWKKERLTWSEPHCDLLCRFYSELRNPRAIFSEHEQNILNSRSILLYQDDWDGQGSIAYSEKTWDWAVRFLRSYMNFVYERFGIVIAAPRILPGPDGSIDLHWKSDVCELLLNIPADENGIATFYADNKDNEEIRGKFIITEGAFTAGLVLWLMKFE